MSFEFSHWKVKAGTGYGFSQSVLTATMDADGLPDNVPSCQLHALAAVGDHLDVIEMRIRPAETGFDAGQWISALALGLQRKSRLAVFEPARIKIPPPDATGARRNGEVIAPYADYKSTIEALHFAARAVSSILQSRDAGEAAASASRLIVDANALQAQLARLADDGVNAYRILTAAAEACIPYTRLVGSAYVVGQGHRSRWVLSTFTDRSSRIGAQIAGNKAATSSVLAAKGLPVARHVQVASVQEAIDAAQKLGFPVVVKPLDRDNGVGVHAGLTNAEQVGRLAASAFAHSRDLLVECFQPGRDYRLTVMEGEVIKAIERLPGSVVGNGRDTIRALVAQAHADEATRRRSRERGRDGLQLDQEALELLSLAGLGTESIPAEGERIVLRRRSNVSTGGTTMVVGQMHPDNRRLAEDAARALRLDVAGVDLILPDIEVSWRETGGIICEVNAQPQLGEQGTPGLYRQFLHRLLDGDGRIPTALVLSSVAHAADEMQWPRHFRFGSGTAVVSGGTLAIDGSMEASFGENLYSAVRAAIMSENVNALVLIASPQRLLRSGLPLDRFDEVLVDGMSTDDVDFASESDVLELYRMLGPHVNGRWSFPGDGVFSRLLADRIHTDRVVTEEVST